MAMNYATAMGVLGLTGSETREERATKIRRARINAHPDRNGGGDTAMNNFLAALDVVENTKARVSWRAGDVPKVKKEAVSVQKQRPPTPPSPFERARAEARKKAEEDDLNQNGAFMATMLETKFVSAINQKLEKEAGAMVLKVHGHGMMEAGWPDLQIYSPRLPQGTIQVEAKVNDGKVSDLQKHRIQELVRRGTVAFVLREFNNERTLRAESADGTTIKETTFDVSWKSKLSGVLLLDWLREVVDSMLGAQEFAASIAKTVGRKV